MVLIIVLAVTTVVGIVFLAMGSKVLPLERLAYTYPVPPLGDLEVGDPPDQDRIWLPKRFDYKPYYKLIPLATFRLAGHVLSTMDYRSAGSAEAQHSPVDFAMAWGEAANPGFYNLLNVSQDHRYYRWSTSGGLGQSEVITQTANMHMVPFPPARGRAGGDDDLEEALMKVKAGDQVRFRGYLVKIQAEDGWRWKSSLSRRDTGGGACELVLVTELDHRPAAKKRKRS